MRQMCVYMSQRRESWLLLQRLVASLSSQGRQGPVSTERQAGFRWLCHVSRCIFNHGSAQCIASPPSAQKTQVSTERWLHALHRKLVLTVFSGD